jgi:hypothetical protein
MSSSTAGTDQENAANLQAALATANKELTLEKKKLKVLKNALKEEKGKCEKVE